MRQMTKWLFPAVIGSMLATHPIAAGENTVPLELKKAIIGDDVELHYVEYGAGVPVLFIHGGLEDYTFWTDHVRAIGEHYRAIAYSRRYNYPNENESRANHSAAVEADDLAALIRRLDLGKPHIIGFSYGGTTALFLAVRYPELVRTLTLAEPALAPWLDHLSAPHTEEGRAVLAAYNKHLVEPARLACEMGDREGAVRITLDYLVRKGMYDDSPQALRELWMRNAKELEAIVISDEGLSAPTPEQVRDLKVPILLLSGDKSVPSCLLADAELQAILPKEAWRRVALRDATHAMWLDDPDGCRKAVLEFFRGK